jgi:hypothetical protein
MSVMMYATLESIPCTGGAITGVQSGSPSSSSTRSTKCGVAV